MGGGEGEAGAGYCLRGELHTAPTLSTLLLRPLPLYSPPPPSARTPSYATPGLAAANAASSAASRPAAPARGPGSILSTNRTPCRWSNSCWKMRAGQPSRVVVNWDPSRRWALILTLEGRWGRGGEERGG